MAEATGNSKGFVFDSALVTDEINGKVHVNRCAEVMHSELSPPESSTISMLTECTVRSTYSVAHSETAFLRLRLWLTTKP